MATTIEQSPLYEINPSTFKWIFIFRNNTIVSGVPVAYYNVSFNSGIFVSNSWVGLGSMSNLVAETKTIPNNAGVGVFNLQRFMESYTAPQYNNFYNAIRNVTFHGVASTPDIYFPIHVIDKYSQNDNCIKYTQIGVNMHGATQPNLPPIQISNTSAVSNAYLTFNGYLQNEFSLTRIGKDFGYDYINNYAPLNAGSYGILSDAPRYQYAGREDYGVISFFNQIFQTLQKPDGIEIVGQFADGTTQTFDILNIDANGGTSTIGGIAYGGESILFCGIFPGNLRQSSTIFNSWLTSKSGLLCYTFRLFVEPPAVVRMAEDERDERVPEPLDRCVECEDGGEGRVTWKYGDKGDCRYDTLTVCERENYVCEECTEKPGMYRWGPDGECIYPNIDDCRDSNGPDPSTGKNYLSIAHQICLNCENQPKGYIPIRITWLNSMGGWDYYTFVMKSSTSIKTKRNDWTQLEGSWNQDSWNPQGWKGGKKAFTVNTKRTITVNSNFVSDEESVWFEKLINSPEIYILEGWEAWRSSSDINKSYEKHVTAVRLMTSSFKRKTSVNDQVFQYTFKFEESRTLNTQPI